MTRRELIALALALEVRLPSTAASRQSRRRRRPRAVPRVNGGINVHPVRRLDQVQDFTPPVIVPEIVDRQLQQVYELGFESMRTTLSFNNYGPDFLGAIPYVRAARALGVDVVGVLGQFGYGYDLTRALSDPTKRASVLDTYLEIFAADVPPASRRVARSGRFSLQILNEPTNFLGLQPADYVELFLAPVYRDLKARRPDVTLVSAAPTGGRVGIPRLRSMIAAGLEQFCDVVGVHVYDLEILPWLQGLLARPVWVTESGSHGTATHLDWFTRSFDTIRTRLPEVQGLYYFDLFDGEANGFRLVEIRHDPGSGIVLDVESGLLHQYLEDVVAGVVQGQPMRGYAELIPDVTRYFPSDDDLARIDAARALL